MGMERVIAAIA
jgi:hypothetical protein